MEEEIISADVSADTQPQTQPVASPEAPTLMPYEHTLNSWNQAFDDLKLSYPKADLALDAKNPRFKSLLRSGLSLKEAYELTHIDEIKREAARASAIALAERIRTRSQRPVENGTGSSPALTVKDNVRSLTPKDRAEAVRRALRGEKVSF